MDDLYVEQISVRERLIDLALYLAVERKGRFATREDILRDVPGYERYDLSDDKGVQAFRRTFENDKKRLREQGFAIETSEDGLSYRLDSARTFMASLDLEPQEVARLRAVGAAVMQSPDFPFASDLRVALAKIIGGLEWGDAQAANPRPALAPIAAGTAAASEDTDRIGLLRDAIARRKKVDIVYQSPGKEPTARTIRPYGDFTYGGAWYCVAFDESHGEVRVLRASRMAEAKVNAKRPSEPDYDIPEGFAVDDYRGLPFQFGSEDYEAAFAIRPELAGLVASITAGQGTFEPREDGGVTWRVHASRTSSAVAWCIENGPGIVPVGPQPLVDAYRAALVARIEGGAADGAR
jgi:predicted DNA-binding transcriptional regulator YafY